jgi:hypothetical protein
MIFLFHYHLPLLLTVIDFPPLLSTSSSHLFTLYPHSISFFLYPFPPPSVPLRNDLHSDPPSRTSYSECYPAGEWRACLVLGSSSLFFLEALTERRVTHQVTLAVLLAVVFSIGVSGEGQDGRAERGRRVEGDMGGARNKGSLGEATPASTSTHLTSLHMMHKSLGPPFILSHLRKIKTNNVPLSASSQSNAIHTYSTLR